MSPDTLLVEDGYRFVCVSGTVRTITDPGTTQADIRRLAARYEGDERAEQQMQTSFSKQDRLSYRFRIIRVTHDGF